MGGAISYLPITYVAMLLASLSLSGVPFFTGFYSKDHMLEVAASQYTILSSFVFWVAALTAFCTAAYSTRLISLALAGTAGGYHFLLRFSLTEVQHSSTTQLYQLVHLGLIFLLAAASLIVGCLNRDLFAGPANAFLGPIEPHVDGEFLNLRMKLLPFFCSSFGIFFSLVLCSINTIALRLPIRHWKKTKLLILLSKE